MGEGATGGVSGETIWMDGEFIPWSDATVHVLTHTLHYGLGVFEGIRCYGTDDARSAVFRLPEHIRRLFDSAKINLLEIPYSQAEIEAATLETMRQNHLSEGYMRPLVFIGDGEMGLNPGSNAIRVAIMARTSDAMAASRALASSLSRRRWPRARSSAPPGTRRWPPICPHV